VIACLTFNSFLWGLCVSNEAREAGRVGGEQKERAPQEAPSRYQQIVAQEHKITRAFLTDRRKLL
jgi:hypothetical protein